MPADDAAVPAPEPPLVSGRRLEGVEAGDFVRPMFGVVERGVRPPPELELPRMRLPSLGVLSPVAGAFGPPEPDFPADALLLLCRELPDDDDDDKDLPFFVCLLLVRFSAMRSLRTHSSYLEGSSEAWRLHMSSHPRAVPCIASDPYRVFQPV